MTDATRHVGSPRFPSADELRESQRTRLAALLQRVMATNPFWRERLSGVAFDPDADALKRIPLLARADIEDDQRIHPPFGSNLTEPLERYCRYHQTSGTKGRPVRFLDTAESWNWWKTCWRAIYEAAGVTSRDRIVFPFSFGPFVGFWCAFDAAVDMGCLSLPAGGMSTKARLAYIIDNDVDVVCCTPTYALRMAEVAAAEKVNIAASRVRALIVAGEPGGNVPATRQRIESAWNARVFDHVGMTEVGPWGFECVAAPGYVHVNESEFIAEVIDPATRAAVGDAESGELVLTNLGRVSCPLLRYRTGDQVRLRRGVCACGRSDLRLVGGVLGRLDDMITVRGNNVFPSGLEQAIRRIDGVAEYRVIVSTESAMDQLLVEIEPFRRGDPLPEVLAADVARAIRDDLHLSVAVRTLDPGSLPRFEMKSRRVTRKST